MARGPHHLAAILVPARDPAAPTTASEFVDDDIDHATLDAEVMADLPAWMTCNGPLRGTGAAAEQAQPNRSDSSGASPAHQDTTQALAQQAVLRQRYSDLNRQLAEKTALLQHEAQTARPLRRGGNDREGDDGGPHATSSFGFWDSEFSDMVGLTESNARS